MSRCAFLRPEIILIAFAALALQLLPLTPVAAAAPVPAPSIVPFEEWAPPACPQPTGADPAPVQRLVVHHTHEPVATTQADVLPALALACKHHLERGFSTLGYHYVVDPWGAIYQGRGALPDAAGRPATSQAEGAHVAGSNGGAVGVVFLGDHEAAPPTVAALESATHLLAWLLADTGRDPSDHVPSVSTGGGSARHAGAFHPRSVSGHVDSNRTACPGVHLIALLPDLRNGVRALLAGDSPTSWEGKGLAGAPGEVAAASKVPAQAAAARASAAMPPQARAAASPTARGPIASSAQVVARDLRDAGLSSLAAKVAARSGTTAAPAD